MIISWWWKDFNLWPSGYYSTQYFNNSYLAYKWTQNWYSLGNSGNGSYCYGCLRNINHYGVASPSHQVEMGMHIGFEDEWVHFPSATDILLRKAVGVNLRRLQDTEISIKIGDREVNSFHELDAAKEFVNESFEWKGRTMPARIWSGQFIIHASRFHNHVATAAAHSLLNQ